MTYLTLIQYYGIIIILDGGQMKALYLVLLASVVSGCHLMNRQIDQDIPISYSFKTLDEAWKYVASLEYKSDMEVHGKRDYWQSPLETYTLGTGDCEDFAILFMHLANRLGYDSELIVADFPPGPHAVMRLGGEYYEAQHVGMKWCRTSVGRIYLVNSYVITMANLGNVTVYAYY
jgi:hypothetical protein